MERGKKIKISNHTVYKNKITREAEKKRKGVTISCILTEGLLKCK